MDAIVNALKPLSDFWNNLDSTNRTRIVSVFVLLALSVTGFLLMVNHKEYVILYSGLDSKDAGEILNKLEEMGVSSRPQGTGAILVPKELEERVRMQLSAEGYPKSGFNYDLFMNSGGFGTTDYEKQKYLQFQLQDRLQNTIMSLDGVDRAVVTISIPEEDSFVLKSDRQPVTASVLLKLKTGVELNAKQISAIEALVTKSVLGLKSENVSIVDSNMNLLNYRRINQDDTVLTSDKLDIENQVRNTLQNQILSLIEPVFGNKKVIVAVHVKLDFDKQITETVKFEPVIDDSGIIVSINELKESYENSTSGGVPGIESNEESITYPIDSNNAKNDNFNKSNRTINYEVNQIKDKIEKSQGQIKELSVSVMIDNSNINDDTKEKIGKLVATAVGIVPENVVIQAMAFNNTINDDDVNNKSIKEALEGTKGYQQTQMIRYIFIYGGAGVIIIIVLVIAYLIFSQAIKYAKTNEKEKMIEKSIESIPEFEVGNSEQMTLKKRIDQLVHQHPEIVIQQVRTWMNEEQE